MKTFLPINLRLLSIANSFSPSIAEHENFSAHKYENAYIWHQEKAQTNQDRPDSTKEKRSNQGPVVQS